MNYLISVDLETYSNIPHIAAIAAVGMVVYDWDTGAKADEYFAMIAQDSALSFGQSDPDTMAWWARQSEYAQRALTDGKTTIPEAMTALYDKIRPLTAKEAGNSVDVVARGPSFDCTILKRHFDAVGLQCPWLYFQERDHRTYESAWLALLPEGVFPKYRDWEIVQHDALSDATAQAEYLIKLRERVLQR